MKYYKKRKRINVWKQQIKKGIYTALIFIGMLSCLNWGIDYISHVSLFVPKTITVLNRNYEVKDSNSNVDELVPTSSLSFVESGSSPSSVKPMDSLTSIEDKVKSVFGEDAPVALAIMKAESGGDPNRIGDTHLPKPSVGLFQISQIYHNYPTEQLLNPDENIRIAYDIYKNGGFDRWTTFRTDQYKNYL